MGFGISGIINSVTKKALIRYIDPDNEEAQGKTIQEIETQGTWRQNILTSYLQTAVGIIQEVRPDVRKSESHRYSSEVTEYAVEDGSIFAQHIIQKPISISLNFEETNAGKMVKNTLNNILDRRKQTLFEQLVDIWKRKIQVEIVTEQAIYKNMVVKSLPIIHKSPYKGAITTTVGFTQITTAQIQVVDKNGATKSIQKSASKKIDGGMQMTTEYKE